MTHLFACRQPIFNRKLEVVGYELLYRNYDSDHAEIVDGDRATSQVILGAFAELGLEKIVGSQKAYINLTRNFLLEKYPIPFPPQQMVLEVLEDTLIDDPLIQSLQWLAGRGYKIALDDVTWPWNVKPLLALADVVKIDLLGIDLAQLPEMVRFLRQFKTKLLAEKVETQKELDMCHRLGFDFFQGYFLCRPNIVQQRRIPPNRLVLLRLISQIQDPQIDFRELEQVLAQDVSLSYKLLQLVNSAYFGASAQIKSIRQAIAYLGLEQLRGWLTLFLLANTDDKPRELTIVAMVRAKMCELLARTAHRPQPETFFLVGLFSVLDALMDLPIDQILGAVKLSPEIIAALLHHQGRLGEAMRCTLAYELAVWPEVRFCSLQLDQIRDAYLNALQWVSKVEKTIEM